jgi:ABC-type glycerol-3-phosphate transport system substrate-binding protein
MFIPAEIAKYTVDGDILGVPQTMSSHGMAVNLEITDSVGFEVKDDWTIADFLEMCELVKQKYGSEKYGTGMFAANPSGDYLYMNWFAAFGANVYENNDYSETGLSSPEALETFKFWDTLMKRGYIPPESAVLTDDDFALDMGAGRYATAIFRSGWVDIYNKNAQNAGLIDHAYPYKFVPLPKAPGVDKPKAISGGGGTVLVFDSGDKKTNQMAVRLAWFLSNAEYQAALTEGGAYPSRTDVQIHPDTLADPHWQVINKITMENGFMTVGYTQPWFYEVRSQMFPVNQKLLNGEYTPAQAQQAYVQAVNKIIREN